MTEHGVKELGSIEPLLCAADLSAKNNHLCAYDSSSGLALTNNVNDLVSFLLVNGAESAARADARPWIPGGVYKVWVSAAVANAALLQLDAAAPGQLVTKTAGRVVAQALEASSGAGIIKVQALSTNFVAQGDLALPQTLTGTTILTAADSGKTLYLASPTEFDTKLPAPAKGLKFTLIVGLAPSGASYTVTTNGTTQNVIHGVGLSSADAGGSASSTGGTPVDVITFVDGQAKVGDRVDIECDAEGVYWHAIAVMSDEDAITFA